PAAAGAEGVDLEIGGAVAVGGGVGIDIGDRATDRADLEEVGRAALDQARRRARELGSDVLDQPGVADWLALAVVVALGGVGHHAGIGHDDDAVVVERRDLGQRLQLLDNRVGLVG